MDRPTFDSPSSVFHVARIINTSSEAFSFGSPGQPNYVTVKAGVVAMTMSTAQVLQKYGVTANVIMLRANPGAPVDRRMLIDRGRGGVPRRR